MNTADALRADAERWYLYVLCCKGDRLYCGIAKDVDARYAEHAAGKGAKFTRAFPPESVLSVMTFDGRSDALKAEAAFKALSKTEKVRKIAEWRTRGLVGNEDPAS